MSVARNLLAAAWLLATLAACGGEGDPLATPPQILTSSLPEGRVGDPYAVVIEVQGGAGPYAFEHTFDVPGLRVDDGGRILGVPTEAGLYSATLQVRGADGGAGARTLPLTILAAGAAPVVEAPCEQPLAVSSAGPVASVRARFGAEEGSSSCGLSAAAQLFLSVDLEEATTVEVELFSERPGAAAVRRVNSTCDSLGSATCAEALSTTLPAGRTLFLVEGRSGDEVLVLFRFIRGGSSPTCTTPVPLEFEDGMVEFEVVRDDEAPARPFCTGNYPVQVFSFHLTDPADLVLDSDAHNVQIGVGGEDCFGGAEVCSRVDAGRRIANLSAGLHHLYAASSDTDPTAVRISLAPATPRPTNDRCVNALPLDLSSGEAQANLRFWSATPDALGMCGESHGLYYQLDLAEPSGLRIQLERFYQKMILLQVPLDTSGRPDCSNGVALNQCAGEICLPSLVAGTYVLAVSGAPEDEAQTLTIVQEPARATPAGDTCAEAPVVTLNAPGTTRIPVVLQGSTATHPDATCGSSRGEVWRAVNLPPGRWRLRFDDPAVVFGPECGDAITAACYSSPTVVLNGGAYRLAIPDTHPRPWCLPPGTPDLELEVDITAAGPPPAGDTCADAPNLALAPGNSVVVTIPLADAANDAQSVVCPRREPDETPEGDVFRRVELLDAARLRVEPLVGSPRIALAAGCGDVQSLQCEQNGILDTTTPIPAGTYWLRFEESQYVEVLVTALP